MAACNVGNVALWFDRHGAGLMVGAELGRLGVSLPEFRRAAGTVVEGAGSNVRGA
jgi:hypothetical protein